MPSQSLKSLTSKPPAPPSKGKPSNSHYVLQDKRTKRFSYADETMCNAFVVTKKSHWARAWWDYSFKQWFLYEVPKEGENQGILRMTEESRKRLCDLYDAKMRPSIVKVEKVEEEEKEEMVA